MTDVDVNAYVGERMDELAAVTADRDHFQREIAKVRADRDWWKSLAEADPASLQAKVAKQDKAIRILTEAIASQVAECAHREADHAALERIGQAVEEVRLESGAVPERTHYERCWTEHAGCLAEYLRDLIADTEDDS